MTTVPCTARPRPTLFAASEPLTAISGADCGVAAAKKFAGVSSKAVVKVSLVMNFILVFRYFQSYQSCLTGPKLSPNQPTLLPQPAGRKRQKYPAHAACEQKYECLLTQE